MSINWVMLSDDKKAFTPLPGEQQLYTSPPRTALTVNTKYTSGTESDSFAVESSAGAVFLTNRRILYLPANPSAALESFAAPILNCYDAHVNAPFFGPNVWTATVQPVPGGNIPPNIPVIEVKMTFKEGGAFDFHSTYERIKDRLQQAVEVARESGQITNNDGRADLQGVNMDSVHLDELPAYEDASATTPFLSQRPPGHREQAPQPSSNLPPSAPPRYEEVQRESVADELERQLRTDS